MSAKMDNANLIREARRRIEQLEADGATVDLHLIGKKGITYFKFTKRPVASQRTDVGDRPTAAQAAEIVTPLMAQFESGTLDAVDVVFSQFKSAVSTPPTTGPTQILSCVKWNSVLCPRETAFRLQ